LSYNFFDQSHEIIFRSLTKLIQKLGGKYYPVRGKSINELIKGINKKSFTKVTLGGCFIERINETILISQESSHKV
jgi:tRNA(Ile)-lysidine synthase